VDLSDAKLLLEVIDFPVTWLALIVGATWTYLLFVRKRLRYPRADLRLSARSWPVSDSQRLVRMSLAVKNTGEVLLRLDRCRVWIQQVLPLPAPIEKQLADEGQVAQSACAEAAWPLVAEKELNWGAGLCEIEPGETQSLDFDLVVPRTVDTALLYAYVWNTRKRTHEIGWDAQATLELGRVDRGGTDGTRTGPEFPGGTADRDDGDDHG
jgi:hypothetical protein